jgi:hypothetical protein
MILLRFSVVFVPCSIDEVAIHRHTVTLKFVPHSFICTIVAEIECLVVEMLVSSRPNPKQQDAHTLVACPMGRWQHSVAP